MKSSIYLLVAPEKNMFKIGKADNVLNRYNQLKKIYPFDLESSYEIITAKKDSNKLEKTLHYMFDFHNIKDLPLKDGYTEFFKMECFSDVLSFLNNLSLKKEIQIKKGIVFPIKEKIPFSPQPKTSNKNTIKRVIKWLYILLKHSKYESGLLDSKLYWWDDNKNCIGEYCETVIVDKILFCLNIKISQKEIYDRWSMKQVFRLENVSTIDKRFPCWNFIKSQIGVSEKEDFKIFLLCEDCGVLHNYFSVNRVFSKKETYVKEKILEIYKKRFNEESEINLEYEKETLEIFKKIF